MNGRRVSTTLGLWMLCVLGVAACSDETATGPMFGDLAFTPSFTNIGSARVVGLTMSNASTVDLGPILVGRDILFRTAFPDAICNSIGVQVTPSSVSSLSPGAEAVIDVELDTSNVDLDECPPEQYDLDLFAAVNDRVLGGATVRFDWDGTPP